MIKRNDLQSKISGFKENFYRKSFYDQGRYIGLTWFFSFAFLGIVSEKLFPEIFDTLFNIFGLFSFFTLIYLFSKLKCPQCKNKIGKLTIGQQLEKRCPHCKHSLNQRKNKV